MLRALGLTLLAIYWASEVDRELDQWGGRQPRRPSPHINAHLPRQMHVWLRLSHPGRHLFAGTTRI